MQISCKLSNSILTYLQDSNEDIIPLLDSSSLSDECLQDPSYWMQVNEAEEFLMFATKHSRDVQNQETALQWIEKIGHSSPQIRCWGVLDSVLRMMPQPTEVFMHAERFVSNFISSSHLIEKVVRSENGIEFQMPFMAEEYPLVSAYIKSSFESIPVYSHQPLAHAEWNKNTFKITWGLTQNILISEEQSGQILNPKLVHSVLNSLEVQQSALLQKSMISAAKNKKHLSGELSASLFNLGPELTFVGAVSAMQDSVAAPAVPSTPAKAPLTFVRERTSAQENSLDSQTRLELSQNISKLGDYMVRAQQLVTLLVGQERMNPSVKKAMDVVDWEFVKKQYPVLLDACREILTSPNLPVNSKPEKNEDSHV